MSNELKAVAPYPNATLAAILMDETGRWYSVSNQSFGQPISGEGVDFGIAMDEQEDSIANPTCVHYADMPSGIGAGRYGVVYYLLNGASLNFATDFPIAGSGHPIHWTGAAESGVRGVSFENDNITAASIAAGAIGSAEAPLLANLDAAVSTRASAVSIAALNNLSSAQAQTAAAAALTAYDPPTHAELTTALAAADDAVLAAIAALNNLSAAQVNAEVVDALNVDTYVQPTGVPAATATLAAKIGRLYQALTSELTVTASSKTFFSHGGAALWKKTLADDGTTYSETDATAP